MAFVTQTHQVVNMRTCKFQTFRIICVCRACPTNQRCACIELNITSRTHHSMIYLSVDVEYSSHCNSATRVVGYAKRRTASMKVRLDLICYSMIWKSCWMLIEEITLLDRSASLTVASDLLTSILE